MQGHIILIYDYGILYGTYMYIHTRTRPCTCMCPAMQDKCLEPSGRMLICSSASGAGLLHTFGCQYKLVFTNIRSASIPAAFLLSNKVYNTYTVHK